MKIRFIIKKAMFYFLFHFFLNIFQVAQRYPTLIYLFIYLLLYFYHYYNHYKSFMDEVFFNEGKFVIFLLLIWLQS